jgi:hypothetical protein
MGNNKDRDEDSADSNEGPEDSESLINEGNTKVSRKRTKFIRRFRE